MDKYYACISAIEYYVPEIRLANSELAEIYEGWNEQRFYQKTGIRERRIAQQDETALDLAEKAARKLLESSRTESRQIDFLMLCTQSPEYYLPTSACILQHRLGLPTSCGAFDYNLGCSGYVYGLAAASAMVESGMAQNILLITADTYSKYIHPEDKSVRTLFGDGAAATLITADREHKGIGRFIFGTDGSGAGQLIVPAGGMKMPKSENTKKVIEDEEGSRRTLENLYMNSSGVLYFTQQRVPRLVEDLMASNGICSDDIQLYVFHQANKFILEYLRSRLNIPKEKFYINMEYIGNTVSSSIPIALKQAECEGMLKKGDRVMLIAFGVGFSWSGTVITWR